MHINVGFSDKEYADFVMVGGYPLSVHAPLHAIKPNLPGLIFSPGLHCTVYTACELAGGVTFVLPFVAWYFLA